MKVDDKKRFKLTGVAATSLNLGRSILDISSQCSSVNFHTKMFSFNLAFFFVFTSKVPLGFLVKGPQTLYFSNKQSTVSVIISTQLQCEVGFSSKHLRQYRDQLNKRKVTFSDVLCKTVSNFMVLIYNSCAKKLSRLQFSSIKQPSDAA